MDLPNFTGIKKLKEKKLKNNWNGFGRKRNKKWYKAYIPWIR